MTEYTVTAIRYQMGDDLSAEGQKQAAIEFVAGLKIGQQVLLAAEPENPVDDKAVAVYINFERIGYIATEQCDEVQQYLDEHRQGRGVVERTDGHLTFFISIPDSTEKPVVIESQKRLLPESPLDDNVKLPYTREESKLQLLATKLLYMDVNEQSIQPIIDMAELYLPLAKLSICHADGYWRDKIFKKLTRIKKQVTKFGLSEQDESRLDGIVHRLREVVGDMHRSSDHWPERIFDNHLNSLRTNEKIVGWFYKKYCDTYLDKKSFAEADQQKLSDERTRLFSWLKNMKWSELRDYKLIQEMGFRVNYLGLSRKEIYDLFSVILLIERMDSALKPSPSLIVSIEPPVLALPLSPLDTIFHQALNVARVKEAIRQIIITRGEAGRYRLSLKQWFVVHKVLEEIGWLDDDTDTRFIEWIRQVFQYDGKTCDFKSVKSEFKHSHSSTWGADTVKDRQTGLEYRALADYVRSQFVTIGGDGSIHDREEFLNLGSDGRPMYIGRGLRKK